MLEWEYWQRPARCTTLSARVMGTEIHRQKTIIQHGESPLQVTLENLQRVMMIVSSTESGTIRVSIQYSE